MQEMEKMALSHTWFPCSQMKDYQSFPPLLVKKALGSKLTLENNQTLIDAISSWWCKSLGHSHPRLKQALLNQLNKFEHIIGANCTHETQIALSRRLCALNPNSEKVFYASDGSCAVEIAMKMSLHRRYLLKHNNKTQFIALQNGYHGETLATLSVSDLGLYKAPYQSHTFKCHYLGPLPYINNTENPLWENCDEFWPAIETQLMALAEQTTAIILEPIVQGAGGMTFYSKDLLQRIANFAKAHDIDLIADEIMTGLGRTGKTLAIEHAGISADYICLSKGLTSGFMPLSCVLTSNELYDLCFDDYDSGKAFLHSHTYGGNALAAAVALETLNIMQEENINDQAIALGNYMHQQFNYVAQETRCLKNVRQFGAIVAAELAIAHPRAGFEVFKQAVKHGALLRPLGNTLYWLPPLTTKRETINELRDITIASILSVKSQTPH